MNEIEQSKSLVFSELNGVLAVAAQRSFRRAAAELGVSASALSHAVASLERRMGVKLFHRTTRSVSLTEAGERFVAEVRPALTQLASAIDSANAFRATPRGTLRINTALAAAKRIFAPVVLRYLAKYPEMRLDLVTEGRLVDIVASGFDAGIRLVENVPKDMVAVPCAPPLRFVVVGSPAYFARHSKPRTASDLAKHVCIGRRMPSGALLRWELAKNGREVSVEGNGPLLLDADELMIAAAERDVGLAWVNEWSVEAQLRSGALETVLDDWCPAFGGLALYYPPHRHVSAGLRAVVGVLREVNREANTKPRAAAVEPTTRRRARRRS